MANAGKTTDIMISGGGIAGLTLGVLLADIGLAVDIIEPKPPAHDFASTPPSGRTVALMDTSLNIIKATGVWDRLSPLSNPLRIMQIIDDSRAGAETIETEFDSLELGMQAYGYNISNAHLRAALWERAAQHDNITIHPHALDNAVLQKNGYIATLGNGTNLRAPLIIGADGRASKVREIAGIKATVTPYHQSAITCLIHHSRAHNDTSTEFHRAGGPLAVVPLPGNTSSVVWVNPHDKTEALLRLKQQEFTDALQRATNDILGGVTLATALESWPLQTLQADKLTAPRIALMAEAAHVMSPITAQGLNLSLRDVATLAELIADYARTGMDIGCNALLETYERRRRMDIKTRVTGVDALNRIVSQDIPAVQNIRRFGLRTVGRIAPLKSFAIRHGLAPTLDTGRLAKGQKL